MLLTLSAFYLLGIRVFKLKSGELCQDHVHRFMFLGHLALGLFIVVPVVLLGLLHRRNTRQRPLQYKTTCGFLLLVSVAIPISGLLLVRLMGLSGTPRISRLTTLPIVETRAGNQEAETHRTGHQTYKRDD